MRQGLTLGVNAIELDHENAWKYTGPKVGNKVALAAAISSTGNWEGSSSTYSAPTGFTVNPMPATSPMSSPQETPSAAPPPPPVYFTIVGPCTVIGACVRSPNYPSNYGSSQSCIKQKGSCS